MLEALSAEALKMRGHKATWFLVWIYPIVCSAILLLAMGGKLAGIDGPETQDAADWIEDTAIIWYLPGNSFGRYLISAFVAVIFAGEYGWNTWKLIVPHRRRVSLIAAKYALVLILFAVTFVLTALLTTILSYADNMVNGEPIPAGVTAAAVWEAQWKGALASVLPILTALGIASFAAVLTRSTIAALVIAIVVTTIEQIIFNFGPVLSMNFSPAVISGLFHALPGYHLENVGEWISDGKALEVELARIGTVALPLATSLGVLAAWIAALAGGTFAVFGRQDIN
jgi:ABC-2 type transport system permease protein